MEPGWEHFEHQADIGIRGRGRTPAEAFEQAALALAAVVTRLDCVEPRDPVRVQCEAPDLELLLADWLNAILWEMSARRMIFSRFEVTLAGGRLEAVLWGETKDDARHDLVVEVKGASYHNLRVWEAGPGEWTAQCVVDV